MFFYLLQYSTLIEKEIDTNTKITKILLYGGISYIVLHATLFIGGKDAILYSLKKYFWLFFILDIITIILINNKDIDINSIFNEVKNRFAIKSNSLKKNNKPNKIEKKVSFVEDNEYREYSEYTSDSDSDIGTDIDFDEFKQTLNL